MKSRCGESGEASVLEMMLVIGFFLLPALLGLSQLPRWVDARSTAELAAQEAVRQYVLAADAVSGRAAGDALARQIVLNHGWQAKDLVGVVYAGALVRGGEVTATVEMRFPALVVPFGSLGGGTVSRSHTERVDDFRDF
jgi:hypothetical protein